VVVVAITPEQAEQAARAAEVDTREGLEPALWVKAILVVSV
jgi:hypothetical protein